MQKLKDKVVLITGASAGIGRACALQFAAAGAHVVAVARNAEKLGSLQTELKGGPSRHLFFPADVTAEPMMAILLSQVKEKYGRLDILVHNAAVGYHASLELMKMETLRKVFEINYFAIVRLTQLALPLLKNSKGHLIFISSVIGRVSVPNYSAYCASKFALEALASALRCEVKKEGVAVSVVCPPRVRTDFSVNTYREQEPQMKWEKMKSAEQMAKKIVAVAATRKRELVYSFGGKFLIFLHRRFPKLLDTIFEKCLIS